MSLQTRVKDLEQVCFARFIKYDKLFTFCSDEEKNRPGQYLSSHIRHLVSRTTRLESQGIVANDWDQASYLLYLPHQRHMLEL